MKRGQRSPGMYAWPKPHSSPLPEYSIELRFVAPMASATAATPDFCVQPAIETVRAITATSLPKTRIFGSPLGFEFRQQPEAILIDCLKLRRSEYAARLQPLDMLRGRAEG